MDLIPQQNKPQFHIKKAAISHGLRSMVAPKLFSVGRKVNKLGDRAAYSFGTKVLGFKPVTMKLPEARNSVKGALAAGAIGTAGLMGYANGKRKNNTQQNRYY